MGYRCEILRLDQRYVRRIRGPGNLTLLHAVKLGYLKVQKQRKNDAAGCRFFHSPEFSKKRLTAHKVAVANGFQICYNETGTPYYYHYS